MIAGLRLWLSTNPACILGLVLISHRHRFIFLKTRKAAGTSLEIALSRFLGLDDVITPMAEQSQPDFTGQGPWNYSIPEESWRFRHRLRATVGKPPAFSQHTPAKVVKLFVSEEVWNTYFKFTTERNSWDLAVSAYWWYQHRHQPGISWADFVNSKALATYSNWPIYTIEDRIVADRVLRYENLDRDLPELARELGVPTLDLPQAKSGYRPPGHYRDMYDASTRRRVAEVFSREIENFGWAFGERIET